MTGAARRRAATTARGLALACHPGPALAVTALTTALAVGAGHDVAGTTLIALALLAGQLSIGWSNDWNDADRDRAVARPDKPVATGLIARSAVRAASFAALLATAPLSLALGWRAGVAHLIAVAGGWAYNFRLKNTAFSWLPYTVSFGLLPLIVTLALPDSPLAPAWAVAAASFLGVGAHLANVLPDLEQDAATGIRGLPHRLGRTRTALLAPMALLAATALVVLGPTGSPTALGWTGFVVATALALTAGAIALRSARSRLPFLLTIAVAAVDVILLVAAGSQLGAG